MKEIPGWLKEELELATRILSDPGYEYWAKANGRESDEYTPEIARRSAHAAFLIMPELKGE